MRVDTKVNSSPVFIRILRKVLPFGVRRSIVSTLNSVDELRNSLKPGGKSRLAKYLDRRAVRRVRKAIITRTDDARIVRWLDRPIWQYPLDAWLIQEMVATLKPDLIVETGTYLGGSAYFFACLCDLLKHGEVISIDVAARGTVPHPRITYIQGSSTDAKIVDRVAERMHQIGAERVLIVLDSYHRADHVRQELECYAPLVPVGCYIHVQDGNMDELPCFRQGRPGPLVAAKSFLNDHPQFIRDIDVELRYVMTEHPHGWLKRISLD